MSKIGKTIKIILTILCIAAFVYSYIGWDKAAHNDCAELWATPIETTDPVCSDFGWYHLKLITMVGLMAIIISLIWMIGYTGGEE